MKKEDIRQQDSFFEVTYISDFNEIKEGDVIPESDFSMLAQNGKFIQFDHVEKEDKSVLAVPGLFEVDKVHGAMDLRKTNFIDDKILDQYTSTSHITNKINLFFQKIAVYRKHQMFPKRSMLIYGKPGCGKTVVIAKSCQDYLKQQDTLVVVWHTDRFDADDMSRFLKRMKYDSKIQKMILIVEDIGGGEVDVKHQRGVESSLLSLLDNSEKIFQVPTMILATTNYPQHLLSNLTDRPQRFDDLIEVKPPTSQERYQLLKFFVNRDLTKEEEAEILKSDYDKMSVAHLKEIIIRADIYDITMIESMQQLKAQSDKVARDFDDRQSMGLGIR